MDKYFGKLSEECGENATPAKKKKMLARKYSENYLQFGFISTENLDFPRILCLLCSKNYQIRPWCSMKLKRHYEGKHELVAHKDENIFLCLTVQNAKQLNFN